MGTEMLRREGRRAVRSLTTALTLSSVAALGTLGVGTFSAIQASLRSAHARTAAVARITTSPSAAVPLASSAAGSTPRPSPSVVHRTPVRRVTARASAPVIASVRSSLSSRSTTPARKASTTPVAPKPVAPKPVAPVSAGTGSTHSVSSGS